MRYITISGDQIISWAYLPGTTDVNLDLGLSKSRAKDGFIYCSGRSSMVDFTTEK